MKVDFMILGAARSATTSICSILASHPSISFSKPKEPQFFSKDDWRNNIDAYHKLFKQKEGVLYGEGSTNYTKYPSFNKNIYQDICEYNPEIKLIYIVRHPIDRIISHYKFALERGYTTETLNDAILNHSIYINTSKYFSQINPYITRFGKDQVKIVFFNDFKEKPQETVDIICGFLDVSTIKVHPKKKHVNQSVSGKIGPVVYDNPKTISAFFKKGINYLKRRFFNTKKTTVDISLSDTTKQFIYNKLDEDIKKLEVLIGRDLSHWRH